MAPAYTLVYFNARGRGEVVRLSLAAAGVKYTDKRVDFADWPKEKPASPQGTLPYLIIDDKHMIPQSLAIVRYLAREYGLYGKSNLDSAKVDVFLDTTLELAEKGVSAFFQKDEEKKKELIDNFYTNQVPKILDLLERSVCGYGGYAVGSDLTAADIYLYSILENIQMLEKLDKYPKLQESCKRVAENKGIKAYLASRPETSF